MRMIGPRQRHSLITSSSKDSLTPSGTPSSGGRTAPLCICQWRPAAPSRTCLCAALAVHTPPYCQCMDEFYLHYDFGSNRFCWCSGHSPGHVGALWVFEYLHSMYQVTVTQCVHLNLPNFKCKHLAHLMNHIFTKGYLPSKLHSFVSWKGATLVVTWDSTLSHNGRDADGDTLQGELSCTWTMHCSSGWGHWQASCRNGMTSVVGGSIAW